MLVMTLRWITSTQSRGSAIATPGASDRIDEIFKANVRRLATAAISEITSRGGQDSENADIHTALLLDLSVQQDKMREGIGGGGPSVEGQVRCKVVDDALHELVSDLPEWRDVVDSVCAQREQQRRGWAYGGIQRSETVRYQL